MKFLKTVLLSLGIISTACSDKKMGRTNYWENVDTTNQLRPEIKKEDFEKLHGFDFGWLILEPIDLENEEEKIIELSRRFSPIQKTIYFFWFLDAQVTNGGFEQFYYNGYDIYLPAIIKGLEVTGDSELLELVQKAEKYYQENKSGIEKLKSKNNLRDIYSAYPLFSDMNTKYYEIHEKSMKMIENYARNNPKDVGILR